MQLLPEGRHQAKIVSFAEPQSTARSGTFIPNATSRPGTFSIVIRLKVGDQVVFSHVVGFLMMTRMLYGSRSFWEGEMVTINCRHKEHDGRTFQSIDIIDWKKGKAA